MSNWKNSLQVAVGVLGMVALLGIASAADAQAKPGTGEVTHITGKVEILPHGQKVWIPATLGAKVAEGDEIRTLAGGSAILKLPDASTLVLAENTRIVASKLEFDPQAQSRNVIFHLTVGKVRAVITKVALALVQTRQSTFAISTPTAVAAARGTDWVTVFNPLRRTTVVAVLQDGQNALPAGSSGGQAGAPPAGDQAAASPADGVVDVETVTREAALTD